MIIIKIAYLGPRKSGKTSIIKYLFEQMKPMDTINLTPTQKVEVTEYNKDFLKLINTEFPGDMDNFDLLSQEQEKIIKEQDIFIYVHDFKAKNQQSSTGRLQNYFSKIQLLNKDAYIYTFFHQSDTDYNFGG